MLFFQEEREHCYQQNTYVGVMSAKAAFVCVGGYFSSSLSKLSIVVSIWCQPLRFIGSFDFFLEGYFWLKSSKHHHYFNTL